MFPLLYIRTKVDWAFAQVAKTRRKAQARTEFRGKVIFILLSEEGMLSHYFSAGYC
jgi:hypothetical protein